MPYATKIEAAAKVVLDAAATGYLSFMGCDSATKPSTGKYVLLRGEKGAEAPLNSGNYHGKLIIEIRDSADTVSLINHRAGAQRVQDVFLDDAIEDLLSVAIPDFAVMDIFGRSGAAERVEDRQWISEITLDLYGCESDLDGS